MLSSPQFTSDTVNLEGLRARLRKMTDVKLLAFGKTARVRACLTRQLFALAGNDLLHGERTAYNLIGHRRNEVVPAADTRNRLVANHAGSGAGGDVNSLLGFTVLALHCHYNIVCFGSRHLRRIPPCGGFYHFAHQCFRSLPGIRRRHSCRVGAWSEVECFNPLHLMRCPAHSFPHGYQPLV
jgi:hypothetical protein